MNSVPSIRIRKDNEEEINPGGDFILYWMIAARRPVWNFALDHAVSWAKELDKPLLVLEALRIGYQWASERLHRFILEGMADNVHTFKKAGVYYYPYVETVRGQGKGLLKALSEKACLIVTDDFPDFFLPRMTAAATRKLKIRIEQVDSNGLLPLRAADQVYQTAYAFRRFLQKTLPEHLLERPKQDPLKEIALRKLRSLPAQITRCWPKGTAKMLKGDAGFLASLPIDHSVGAVDTHGGFVQSRRILKEFLEQRLTRYLEKRSQPEEEVSSGLSPYLHFGHIAVHEVFHEITGHEDWYFDRLSSGASGSRAGWWGMSESAEAFLDELVTWRELGYNMCCQRQDYDQYGSLPDWALATLSKHEADKRPYLYKLKAFEQAQTHDPLWNAAQVQLITEGRIHNYLRMLWGKRILHWSQSPRQALEIMIELNNKYALDGRDPNSYSGIFWVLGRYDRPWGPERPVFGKIRYMSSKNTARKVRVRNYIEKYAPYTRARVHAEYA